MMKSLGILSIALVLGMLVEPADAQTTTTQTTFSATVTGVTTSPSASPTQTVCLTSSTGVAAPGFNNPALTMIVAGREAMVVNAATPNANCWSVTRGYFGTSVAAHSTSEIVWVGPTGGLLSSPFINNPPAGGVGSACNTPVQAYNPVVVVGSEGYQTMIGTVWSCPSTGLNANTWVLAHPTMQVQYGPYYIGIEGGANTAITGSYPGLTLTAGNCVSIQLAHTLQAGANTFALNGGTAKSILSHWNTSNNIGTAYAATGVWTGCYNGTAWLDVSE